MQGAARGAGGAAIAGGIGGAAAGADASTPQSNPQVSDSGSNNVYSAQSIDNMDSVYDYTPLEGEDDSIFNTPEPEGGRTATTSSGRTINPMADAKKASAAAQYKKNRTGEFNDWIDDF